MVLGRVGIVALVSVAVFCGGGIPAAADILDPVVTGNEVSARVFFPGLVDVGVTVSFEEVDGLSLQSLGLSAEIVSTLDPTFTSRLPPDVSLLSTLPLKLVIDPPQTGGLSFRGLATVYLDADPLLIPLGAPLRVFAAQPGEPFHDVTTSKEDEWEGSYRVGGNEPEFEGEYVYLLDYRPVADRVVEKLEWLEDTLAENQTLIDPPVYLDLSGRVTDIRQAIEEGRIGDALQDLNDFLLMVQQRSGTSIPDRWRALRDLVNVAGALRSVGATLQLSLQLEE